MEVLDRAFLRTKSVSTEEARNITEKTEEEDPFFLITTYNPQGNALREIVDRNWEVFQRSSATKQLAAKKPMFWHR